jgi:hypothetical protein
MGVKVMNKRTGGPMPKIYKTTKGNFTARELAKIGGLNLDTVKHRVQRTNDYDEIIKPVIYRNKKLRDEIKQKYELFRDTGFGVYLI